MLYVLESPSGPANVKEYFYSGTIEVKNHVALVESEGAKTYLFHLGYRYLGDIENPDQLEEFLKTRNPKAMPGDVEDNINHKVNPKLVKTVKTETVVQTSPVRDKLKETKLNNEGLPAAGGSAERWWDRPE